MSARVGALLPALLALGLAVAGCTATPATPSSAAPSSVVPPTSVAPAASGTATASGPATASGTACADLAAGLPLAEQVGELLMAGVAGSLDAGERDAIAAHHVGSVLLMGNSTAGVDAVRALTDEIAALGGATRILVAVDQEGGVVQRLQGPGFDTIPPAAEQARLTDAELAARATAWGEQLVRAGVHLDLAPVADVVPAGKASTNEPVGRLGRGYGATPDEVATKVAAFIDGMHAAGVATSAKHFPNLGEVVGNTDFFSGVVDTVTGPDAAALRPFAVAVEHGTETVMVATAVYTLIDPDNPAAFSPAVLALLRDGLGYGGVIISDDLGAAEAVRDVPAGDRALRFVRAGGDLVITADPALVAPMASAVLEAARADAVLAARVEASAARVLTMKAGLGLASCQPVVG